MGEGRPTLHLKTPLEAFRGKAACKQQNVKENVTVQWSNKMLKLYVLASSLLFYVYVETLLYLYFQ